MRRSMQIRIRGLKDLVLWLEGPGQLRGWWWEIFHLRGHKDVPLVTLQFCHIGIKCWNYAKSVTEYTGTLEDGNRKLLSMQPVQALQQGLHRQLSRSETLGASSSLRTCSRKVGRRIKSSDRYCPLIGVKYCILDPP